MSLLPDPTSTQPDPPAQPPARQAHLALYRKYRSATFGELIGQDHVTAPLRTALGAGRVNHAYLFSGPRGCGKTSSARILARSLNCAQGPTPDPCGVCDSCVELAPNGPGSIDVIEIDAASHGGVDDARELRERAFFAPVRDRFKVYIIDEAHMVTTQGFNALLKLVEEPPDFLVFVFATTEPDKVLQTIRSRTHHYPFRLIPPGVMRAHLEGICAAEGLAVEPAVIPLVVRAGGGSARDALSILDQLAAGSDRTGITGARAVALLGVTDSALLDGMIEALAVADAAGVYGAVDRVVEAGHDPRRFAGDLLDRLRDLIVLAGVPDAVERGLIDEPADVAARMVEQSGRLGVAALTRYAEIVHQALVDMRGTTSPRLLLELVCARMLLPDAADDTAALLQRLEALERRLVLGGPPPSPAPQADAGSVSAPRGTSAPGRTSAAPAVPPPPVRRSTPEQPADPSAPAGPSAPAVPSTPAGPSAPADPSTPAGPSPDEQPHPPVTPPGSPAAAAGSVTDVGAVQLQWPTVLDAVKGANRTTRALLENARVAALEARPTAVHLTLSAVSAPLAAMMNEQRNVAVLVAALGSVLGGSWTVEVQHGPAGEAPAAPTSPARRPAEPDPRDDSDPGEDPEPGRATARDPETEAVRLLRSSLDAHPIDG